jgi:hypothetical protein
MIVSVELFLTGIDGLFMGLNFLLVDDTLHRLHVFILYEVLLVNLLVDEVADKEGDGHGSHKGNDCSPNDHGGIEELVSVDAGDDDTLDGPVDEDDSHTGKTRVALFMGEISQGVKSHAGPSVILVVIVVDFIVGAVGAEVEHPVEEDPEPGEP